MNRSVIATIVILVAIAVVTTLYINSEYQKVVEKGKIHEQNIINNLQNYTKNDCDKLTMMNKILENNQFGKIANGVIKDKIQEFDCD